MLVYGLIRVVEQGHQLQQHYFQQSQRILKSSQKGVYTGILQQSMTILVKNHNQNQIKLGEVLTKPMLESNAQRTVLLEP